MNLFYGGCMYPLNSQSSSTLNTHLSYYIAESSNDGYQSDGCLEGSNDQLAVQITTLAGQINAANYRLLKLIAEFDRRKGWEGYGIRSCAHWLNWKCGIAMAAAREKVRTAKALEGLPAINEAFQKGSLSFSKVRAMTRVATEENEDYLLNIAEYGTAQHMEVLVKAYRTVSRIADKPVDFYAADIGLTEEEQEKRRQELQYENRMVSCYQDDDGSWIIKAKLPQEEGGLIAKVLKELGDKIADSQSCDNQLRQDSKASLDKEVPQKSAKNVSAETFSDESDSTIKFELDKKEERITFPQRRADALVTMAEHYLASSGKDSILSLKGAERCQLVMHVTTAKAGIKGTELGQNLDGRWLIPDAARKLACDASLVLVEEDTAGNVLNIGRRSRIIPPAMQRALAIRDGGCQFPGCCETRYVEGHHIKHWADGGETKLDNLVTLCRYHHRELHKGSFYLSLKPEQINQVPLKLDNKPQRFAERLCFSKVDKYWNAPFNKTKDYVISANPAKFTCACCDSSELGKAIPRLIYNAIDEKTAVTKWTGERMDLEMAVDGLLAAKKRHKKTTL
jgi:hypothetical protein